MTFALAFLIVFVLGPWTFFRLTKPAPSPRVMRLFSVPTAMLCWCQATRRPQFRSLNARLPVTAVMRARCAILVVHMHALATLAWPAY